MSSVKYSIVIPTRERPETLQHCLNCCLAIDYSDYEIIVHDNCSSPETRRVVDRFASPRIKYYRTDRTLSMTKNWEAAMARAAGEWITFIGDDDGMLPYAFEQLDRLIEQSGMKMIQWTAAYYVWPSRECPANSDYLAIPLQRACEIINARDTIKRIAKDPRFVFGNLAGCYHGMVHRSIIDEAIAVAGSAFIGYQPDLYSALSTAFIAREYLFIRIPISIVGHSPKSNGGIGLAKQDKIHQEDTYADFYSLSREDRLPTHPWIGPIKAYPETGVLEPLLLVQDLFYPSDTDLRMDRQTVIEMAVSAFRPATIDDWESFNSQVRESVKSDSTLLPWVEQLLSQRDWKKLEKPVEPSFPKGNGYLRNSLHLDASKFGVDNIHSAAALCENILCLKGNNFDVAIVKQPTANKAAVEISQAVEFSETEFAANGKQGRLDRLGLPRSWVRLIRSCLAKLGKKY